MARFGTFDFGEELFASSTSGGSGSAAAFVRVPWTFQSVHDDDSYEFAINPLDASMPSIEKTFTSQATAAGGQVLFQGRNAPQKMSFSGTILTEVHLNAMREWSAKQKQVSITDDLTRKYWVYITSFSPTRNYKPEYPWMHEFSCEATVLDWGTI